MRWRRRYPEDHDLRRGSSTKPARTLSTPPCRRSQGRTGSIGRPPARSRVHRSPGRTQEGHERAGRARGEVVGPRNPGFRSGRRRSRCLCGLGTRDDQEREGHGNGSPDAFLVGGLVLLFCVIALVALRLRKRTVVALSFMLNGLALTLILLPLGFALVLLGGWLMLRPSRINRYGTANSKAVARQASERRRGRSGAGASSKAAYPRRAPGSPPSGRRRPRRTSATRRSRPQGRSSPSRRSSAPPAELPWRQASGLSVGLSPATARPHPRPPRGSGDEPSTSTTSAERKSRSTSARRRTSERAVGSSPCSEHLDLGDHADHRRIDGQQEQPRIVSTHGARIHLGFEECGGTLHQGLQGQGHLGRGRGSKAPDLAQEPEQLRLSRREVKH